MADSNTGNTGNTSTEGKEKQEMDLRVQEAFELAAKELGISVKFEGLYVFIDKECPAGTEDQLKKVENECEANADQN